MTKNWKALARGERSTIKQRQEAFMYLAKTSRVWIGLSDVDLLTEVQKVHPAVTKATRDECLRMLFLDYVDREIAR